MKSMHARAMADSLERIVLAADALAVRLEAFGVVLDEHARNVRVAGSAAQRYQQQVLAAIEEHDDTHEEEQHDD